MTISVILMEVEGGLYATYSLGGRIAMTTSVREGAGPVARNIEFRELSLIGSARLKFGEPVTVSRIGGESLQLTVSKAE